MEGVQPTDTIGTGMQYNLQVLRMELPTNLPQLVPPVKRLNAMTSNAAPAALRRAIQSSPARWVGSRQSPIDAEDELGSTRRLLFPSPRKDESPKVLGEVQPNITQSTAEHGSPKEQLVGSPNKENCPPGISADHEDAELLALVHEELARPSTPVRTSQEPNPFKTPTRPTPSHRPITRSVSKSIRSARSAKSPGQLLPFGQQTPSKTPSSMARRRSPRNHYTVFESPFTATINQLMSEANDNLSPTQQRNTDYDFSNFLDLPLMSHTTHRNDHPEVNWDLNDFFSTDIPMPSSPPRTFQLYEDPAAISNVDWGQFSEFASHPHDSISHEGVVVKKEPGDEQQALIEGSGDHPEQAPVIRLAGVQEVEVAVEAQKPSEEPTQEHAEKRTEDPAEEAEVDMVVVEKMT